MNVVHSVPSLGESGGGPPRSVSQLCDALVTAETSIEIVTGVDKNDPIVALNSNISLKALKGQGQSFLGRLMAANFEHALEEIHTDRPISVVHQHGIWLRSSHATTKFASRCKIPLVVSPRGMLESWAVNHSKWKKQLAWTLYQKYDLERVTAFHATAHSEADSIRRMGLTQPIAVIPNGIEFPHLAAEHGELRAGEASSKQVANLTPRAPEKRTALFLSRINPKKGLPMLLDVWKKVAPEGWRLIIAGNDDSRHLPVVQAKIAEHGLHATVEVVGPLFGDAKDLAFRNADIFLLPSYSENFGIVVTEALSYGLPVLTTTGCPWKELETEQCGWWVEPTPRMIEKGLAQAFSTSDAELRQMGARGRALVERCYLWPQIATNMSRFYEWLQAGGEPPEFVV